MKRYLPFVVALFLFAFSLTTFLNLRDHPSGWRYYSAMAGMLIFGIMAVGNIVVSMRKSK